MFVSAVMPEHYEAVWDKIADYMEGAAKYTYGRYSAQDIKDGLYKNRWQLWIAFENNKIYGAAITEIMQYPQMKVLTMHFTGGVEFSKWHNEIISIFRSFAKDEGCQTIEAFGRRGWKKVFENDGFKSNFIFFELPVEGNNND